MKVAKPGPALIAVLCLMRTTLLCAKEVTLKNQADREVEGNDRISHH